jgi:hypothetical protein
MAVIMKISLCKISTYIISIFLTLLLCASAAQATQITVSSMQLPDFYPDGLTASVSATVNTSGTTVTRTAGGVFNTAWPAGMKITINSVVYELASVTSSSVLVLSTSAGSQTGVSATIHPYVLLRFYADRRFTVSDSSKIIQPGTPGSSGWYKQYGVSVIANTAYIPQITLDSTVDAVNSAERNAKYQAGFYTSGGGDIQAFACFEQFAVPATPTTTTWPAICTYNSTNVTLRVNNSTYNTDQINALVGGLAGSTALNFTIGNTTAASGNTFCYRASSTSPYPAICYDGSLSKWRFTNDGVTYYSLSLVSGTSGYIPRFTASDTLGAGLLQDDGTSNVKMELTSAYPTLTLSAYGTLATPLRKYIKGNGTLLSPTRVLNANNLGELDWYGQYDSTVGHIDIAAQVTATALESFTSSAYGTVLRLTAAGVGSTDGINGGLGITGNQVRFYGSSGGYTALKASATAGNVTFTLPDSDGTSGQVIQTNGLGVWSFVTPTSPISGLTTNRLPKAASATTLTDSQITEASGPKIGILQGSPASLLSNASAVATDPAGNTTNSTNGFSWTLASTGYAATITNTNNANSSHGLYIQTTQTDGHSAPLALAVGSNFGFYMGGDRRFWMGRNLGTSFTGATADLRIQSDGTTSGTYGLVVDSGTTHVLAVRNDNRVGINTDVPSYDLHVNGNGALKHLVGLSPTPSGAIGTSCTGTSGNGASVTVGGTDAGGEITLVTASSGTGGSATCATITFNAAYGAAPHVVLLPADATTAALSGNAAFYLDRASTSTSAFVIKVGSSAPATSTTYKFTYLVIE